MNISKKNEITTESLSSNCFGSSWLQIRAPILCFKRVEHAIRFFKHFHICPFWGPNNFEQPEYLKSNEVEVVYKLSICYFDHDQSLETKMFWPLEKKKQCKSIPKSVILIIFITQLQTNWLAILQVVFFVRSCTIAKRYKNVVKAVKAYNWSNCS